MTDADLVRKILRAFWFLAGATLVGFLAIKNLPPDGILEAHAGAGQVSPFISVLRPVDRVTLEKDGVTRYLITADPVYFQLAIPRLFRQATVTVTFRNPEHLDVSLGPSTSLTQWGFALQPLDTKDHHAIDLGDGWRRATATFDVSQMAIQNGEVQMAISVPMAGKVPGVVEVSDIAVRYVREPLTFENVGASLARLLHL